MNINKILEEICAKGSIYDEIIDNILGYNHPKKQELISEIAISYLENAKKIEGIYKEGYFKYYFIQTITNQVRSNKSPFYKNTVIRINEIPFDLDMIDDVEQTIKDKMELERKIDLIENSYKGIKKNWFKATMFEEYFYENKSYRDIERDWDIDHVLAWKEVKKMVSYIKEDVEKKNKN